MPQPEYFSDEQIQQELGQASQGFSDEQIQAELGGQNQSWNPITATEHALSGAGETIMNMLGTAANALPLLDPMQRARGFAGLRSKSEQTMGSQIARDAEQALLKPYDPNYRYSRSIGDFLPFMLTGEGSIPSKLMSTVGGGIGAQGAEDITGNKTIAPVIGAVLGAGAPSVLSNLWQGGRQMLLGATPAEIKGSAALAQQELTGLEPQQIRQAMAAAPADELGQLMTTAEVTGNPGMAQIEKELAGSPQGAQLYNDRLALREGARESMLNAMSETPQITKTGLGESLINKATSVAEAGDELESAFWQAVPKNVPINVGSVQKTVADTIGEKGAGLGLSANTQKLVGQIFNAEEKTLTSGDLQAIRSDALWLIRNKFKPGADPINPFEERVLNSIASASDTAVKKGMQGEDYAILQKARKLTAQNKSVFNKSTVGGLLTKEGSRESTVFDRIFGKGKGDAQTVQELSTAIGKDPALLEDVKRGMLDSIKRDASGAITADKMDKFVASNEGAIKELFGDDHLTSMQRILQDLKSQESVAKNAYQASKGGSITAQKQTVAGAISQSVVGKILPGSGMMSNIANILRKSVGEYNEKQINELLLRAAMTPEYALELAQTPTAARLMNWVDRLKVLTTSAALAGAQGGFYAEQGNRAQPLVATPPKQEAPAPQRQLDTALNPQLDLSQAPEQLLSMTPQRENISYGNEVTPELLDAIKMVESGGNLKAVSSAGAQGPYQLMPATGREYHSKLGIEDPYDPFDEEQSRMIAEAILRDYQRMMGGDLWDAVTAYNQGPGNVKKGTIGPTGRKYAKSVFSKLLKA